MPGGVLCCGNLVEDILVRPVDRVVFDTTTWVESIGRSVGGNGANTSYALAKLGTPVRLAACAGEDESGERVIRELASAGVDVAGVRRIRDAATATTVALVASNGARAFLHCPGVSRVAFGGGLEFSAGLVEGCSHFHLANPFSLDATRVRGAEMLAGARRAGLTTSCDAGWDSRGQWIEVLGPCLEHLDLLFVNEEEGRMLSGREQAAGAAQFFRDRGAGRVVVKLGARGCLLADAEGERRIPGFKVAAVDSTGAGDCFAGGFLAGLHHGMKAGQAARLANAAGALNVGSVGAVAGLRSYAETLEWMQRADLE
jgi:sugar/nucleoside kinase (ribokinase family)